MSRNILVVIQSHGHKNGHIQLSLPLKVLYLHDFMLHFHITHTLMIISASFHKILTPSCHVEYGAIVFKYMIGTPRISLYIFEGIKNVSRLGLPYIRTRTDLGRWSPDQISCGSWRAISYLLIREIPDHATFRGKGVNTGLVRQTWGLSLFGPM